MADRPLLPDAWSRWAHDQLEALREARLIRELRPLQGAAGAHPLRPGAGPRVLFSSNDYLGLSGHPRVRRAMAAAAGQFGSGPRGSPLICGHTTLHEDLEAELASLKGKARALLFPTGFAANLAALAALGGGEDCAIFSDALNHASIIDGVSLARRRGATLSVYPHGDMEALEEMLRRCQRPRRLVVSDSVFSMDGDLARLEALVEIKTRHEALLMIDEAHATLVYGAGGGGLAEACGLSGAIDVSVGTLSKAVGAQGGFVACDEALWQLLVNGGRSFVFSTALPVPTVAGALEAIRTSREEPELRARLWRLVERLGQGLGQGLDSPIAPVILGTEARALRAAARLWDRGYHVVAIRPPTVPVGTSRLRITLSAAHSEEEVDGLVEALRGEVG